ncbi:UmuC domain-containing protein [Fusarium keratoplasticum]|uniref:UmuC domain-containing protein n=1 Tax=Fusarium keratoplasticum TaxID=1328300 RepID=A0ACC0QZD2_9HYPO|nr:UmuC domain-containing protein [Fusarium keratoplasticum]KAI8670888.1 UmuC domain-containing protein [Fusarium keratoplasticum]KAI8678122.1 UmuC domain-containing protein [Fusarium keratoplasticum]
METPNKKRPRWNSDRVILQFDYDCFYAQVFENKNPALKKLPVGVKQKNCLATCNYNARALGLKKLMSVSEAKRVCPELVLMDGEDLTPFRDTSKILFNYFKTFSWNHKVERLGFDEIFMDVTDIVEYNLFCLNKASLANSFFCLSKKDPERGFQCDLTSIAGCVQDTASQDLDTESPAYLRLLLGSHLAQFLRLQIEEKFGFTSTCGIASNKMLSKLVGGKNKPRNQTTLLALTQDEAIAFLDDHKLRKIPGLGFKTVEVLGGHVGADMSEAISEMPELRDVPVTVGQVRLHPNISPGTIETLLMGPGAERGVGSRIWGLLHGVDPTEVKEASDMPSQISIEDTYKGLETIPQIAEELHKLSCSLVRRMRVDLLVPDQNSDVPGSQRWIARPKTLRLSVRSWAQLQSAQSHNSGRVSRSSPLPSFVFDVKDDIDRIAERLVSEALLPLLRRLSPEKGHRWNLQMLNICVANMVAGAADDKTGAGRDISAMFRRQDEVLRPFQVIPDQEDKVEEPARSEDECDNGDEEATGWSMEENVSCPICGHAIPPFAVAAHQRYHEMGEE